jgi:hypothetical protein
MDLVSALWAVACKDFNDTERTLIQQGGRPEVDEAKQRGRHSGNREAVATTAIAERGAELLLGHPPSPRERREEGRLAPYGFGAIIGAFYGATAEKVPVFGSGFGIRFGLTAWLGGVEVVLPSLGLSEAHAFAGISHAAYGLATDTVWRVIRRNE